MTTKGFSILVVAIFLALGVVVLAEPLKYTKNSLYKGNYDSTKTVAYFHGQRFDVPSEASTVFVGEPFAYEENVLGSRSGGEKRIEVDLNKQKLYAYEGTRRKYTFDVSTGKWNLTPTGEFRIWTKLKYTLMAGGSKEQGTYYYLPNVPYTMFFYQDYGIHGAYWHSNFGHPMSHGCINMRIEDAEKLFYWANPPLPQERNSTLASKDNPGTKVVIYGETPKE